ncbi:MAG: hypothetical protein ACRCS8_02690 [Brevinema sp.]
MSEVLSKVVIVGWNNITASIAEGIRMQFPECEIYSPDAAGDAYQQARSEGYLDLLPDQKALIYEDADYVILGHNGDEALAQLSEIECCLTPGTCVMDFQHVKVEYFDRTLDLLPSGVSYVSAYVFLDEFPLGVRKNIFKDKIIAIICDNSQDTLNSMKSFWAIFDAKIIPTSAEFYDEIFATTIQTPNMIATIFSHILQKDSWADTLFFGFYNKHLRNFVSPVVPDPKEVSQNMVHNRENMIRMLSFMKREIDVVQDMIDNENVEAIEAYIKVAKQFKNRI